MARLKTLTLNVDFRHDDPCVYQAVAPSVEELNLHVITYHITGDERMRLKRNPTRFIRALNDILTHLFSMCVGLKSSNSDP